MKMRAVSLAAILLAATLAGCTDDGGSGEASVSLYVQGGASEAFREVHVTVTEAYVRQQSETAANASPDGSDDADRSSIRIATGDRASEHRDQDSGNTDRFQETDGWALILKEPDGLEMGLDEASTVRSVFLDEGEVPSGAYSEAGLFVEDGFAVDGNGTRMDLSIVDATALSATAFETANPQESRIVLELNVTESLSRGDRGWRLSPTFADAQIETVDDDASGEERHEPGEPADLDG